MVAFASRQSLQDAMELAARILSPKLDAALAPGALISSVGASFHIQDGRLCHVKELDEAGLELGATNGKPLPSHDSAIRAGLQFLRAKLDACLVSGYHGFVVLTFALNHGSLAIRCSSERVHKVPHSGAI